MWLNKKQTSDTAIKDYRSTLLKSCPSHIVIDNLFNEEKLNDVIQVLQQPNNWKTQKHTYSKLYVDDIHWNNTNHEQRFVQRDSWQRNSSSATTKGIAHDFLSFLRGDEYLALLSRIFNTVITDINVENPEINTNYFRLSRNDFIEQHADDSPGREICMLLYLNKHWQEDAGGELVFAGEKENGKKIRISPQYNRCVLFDPSSEGSEHWVKKLNTKYKDQYRYNITSWYWSE
tara:strand:+ start:7102 stop:7797 length:696 start_codon:yes stop_codon:yes gene_type:complete